jgi:hypothetical protein
MGQIMFKEVMSDYVEKRSWRPIHESEQKEAKE